MNICIICNTECKSQRSLLQHVKNRHKLTTNSYYNILHGKGICKTCGKPTKFLNFNVGYRQYCSAKCAANNDNTKQKRVQTNIAKYGCENISQLEEVKHKKTEKFKSHLTEIQEKVRHTNRLKYGCDWVTQSNIFKQAYKDTCTNKYGVDNYTKSEQYLNQVRLRKNEDILYMSDKGYIPLQEINVKYGTGWHQQNRGKVTTYKNKGYVDLKYLPEIEQYSTRVNSKFQQEIFNIVGNAIQNTRKIISPYELDIYLPDLHIAVEVNGNYWHSIEAGCSNDYHLMKSLLCREKHIRLIHIYEFEDIEEQKQLLKDLINGQDNYPKNDFNKNNLLENIPEPTIIYKDHYAIYGAGPLIKE